MTNKIINKSASDVCEALHIEAASGVLVKQFQKMDAKTKWELLERCPVQPFSSRTIVSLFDEPIDFQSLVAGTPGIVSTKGTFSIAYNTMKNQLKNGDKPYAIYTDLLQFHKIQVSGPHHLDCIAQRIPEVAWMLRNSNYDPYLFALAKMHPGTLIPFSVNWAKYGRMIIAKANEKNMDIDNKPLVCYKCSYEDFDNKYNKVWLAPKHDEKYYEKELKEAEKEAKEDE